MIVLRKYQIIQRLSFTGFHFISTQKCIQNKCGCLIRTSYKLNSEPLVGFNQMDLIEYLVQDMTGSFAIGVNVTHISVVHDVLSLLNCLGKLNNWFPDDVIMMMSHRMKYW